MIVHHHPEKYEVAPGWWVPKRPGPGSLAGKRGYREHCADRGHHWHPSTVDEPSFCCYCGRARHFLDRLMGH